MDDLTFQEIKDYQRKYFQKSGTRLEVSFSTDCSLFFVEFGLEAWSCFLARGISYNSFKEAWEKVKRVLEDPNIEVCETCHLEIDNGCYCEEYFMDQI